MSTFSDKDLEGIESARLFRAAFGHLQHGVIIYNQDLKMLEINDRVRELLEIPASELAVGDSFEKLVRYNAIRGGYGGVGSVEDRVAERMAKVRNFEPFHEDQILFNERYCEVFGRPVEGGGYVLTYTDITDRVNAEQAKNQFLAKISHDIRTPINGVMGMAEFLELSELDDRQERMVSTIVRSSRILLRLVDDILDLTRLESGKLDIEDEFFDLQALLNDVVSTLQVIAAPKNVDIKLKIDPDFPRTIFGDPTRLAQCAINLIGNAVKFSDADSQHTKNVFVNVARHGDSLFSISIQDQGIGIDTKELKTLFKPFTQGNQNKGKHPEGSGLGLAIVSQLIELMDGNIEVDSVPGEGSCFTLKLPLVDMGEDGAEPETSAQSALTEDPVARSKILLVEDNEDNRDVLSMQLEALGQEVETACDGAEGVEKWRKGKFALILSDCNMPVMDGLTMAKAIRQEERDNSLLPTPIIAITGNAVPEDLRNCLEAGMNDYLTKPLTMGSLKKKISAFLD